MDYQTHLKTPAGMLLISANDNAVTQIQFVDTAGRDRPNPITNLAAGQLIEYFERKRKIFKLPLSFRGTPFQESVWRSLMDIPYGQSVSYMYVARQIGRPKANRAVGSANGKNPICIVIPCHRVIAADGTLGGYTGGLWHKEKLLALEKIPYKSK